MAPSSDVSYGRFARHYDQIYEGIVDYEGDVDFLEKVFRRFRLKPIAILDLGCGTGNHDLPLARRGYDVTGVDRSRAMLVRAREKAVAAGVRVRFVRADMRSFDLGRTFGAAVCMFGAFGYLLTPRDIARCLRSVRRHLSRDGLFVFEFWQGSAARPSPSQSWTHKRSPEREIIRLEESRFDPDTGRLPVEFRFFVLRDAHVLERFEEVHIVQTHHRDEIRTLLRRSGFDLLGAFAATNMKKGFGPATDKTFRVMAVARPRAQS
ncbi:MAG TPA: class I SAM-dependent methyltransferase [Thermoplasmata archaeon]